MFFSASPPYLATAAGELRTVFPGAEVRRLGPDFGHVSGSLDLASVAEAALANRLVFVRHLTGSLAVLDRSSDPDAIAVAILDGLVHASVSRLALQVWASVPPGSGERPDLVRRAVAERLSAAGLTVARAGESIVASVCLTQDGVAVGLAARDLALADWPGGRVRFRRGAESISRAEFKLEEAIDVFGLHLPDGAALDLGASPGGWTRILREHGLEVWAVDPGDLAPGLSSDTGVHHVRTTAGAFLRTRTPRFSIVVNDMRMEARRSARVLVAAAERLAADGLAVMTCKLTPQRPHEHIEAVRRIVERRYDVLHLRQLHHNRNEATLVARRLRQERASG